MSDGKDLRTEKLTDRKQELRRLLSKTASSRLTYVDHVENRGTTLFDKVCELDLEGIVAKHSHAAGREKLFERERHREPVPGWHTCDLACAEVTEVEQ